MPTIPEALASAIAHHQGGQLQTAEQIYRQILQAEPNHAHAIHFLGLLAHQVGQHETAIRFMERAIVLKPDAPEFHYNLAKVYDALQRAPEAAACCRRALGLKPDFAEAQNNLGLALLQQGQPEEAITTLRQALALKPDFTEAHHNLGEALRALGRLDDAIDSFRRAVALTPNLAEAHHSLGLALMDQGGLDEAVASFQRAASLKPSFAKAHNDLGVALKDQGQPREAEASLRRALELDPNDAIAHNNLGNAFKDQRKLDDALASYHRALALEPELPALGYNLGTFLLLLGQYQEGWRHYERRLACSIAPRNVSTPRWDGGPAPGRTILIQSEQGLGDALQFVRYAPLVRQRAGAHHVILETPPPLMRLFAQSNGDDVEIAPAVGSAETSLPPHDLHAPLLSLPLALGIGEPLPMNEPYLRADSKLREAWRERLGPASAIRVGVAWAGNPKNRVDRVRSLPLESLQPLLRLPGPEFYSLRLRDPSNPPQPLAETGLIDLTAHLTDFADTAAFLAELDLVISVDTAVAHLAGAMGRPVWTLLPFQAEWRWGLAPDATPWYPTMRLFRQPSLGDWPSVIHRLTAELESMRARPSDT